MWLAFGFGMLVGAAVGFLAIGLLTASTIADLNSEIIELRAHSENKDK